MSELSPVEERRVQMPAVCSGADGACCRPFWDRGQYKHVRQDFARYWLHYGGLSDLLGSPYLHAAGAFTVLAAPFWLEPNWWADVISAVPSLLGFTLGGMALLLAFGNDRFKELMAKAGGDSPRLLLLSAAFVHFILVQCVALLAAFLCKGWYRPAPKWLFELLGSLGVDAPYFVYFTRVVFWGPAFFVFVYSIMCAVAATLRIFSLTSTFVKVARNDAQAKEAEALAKAKAAQQGRAS